jgi:hypothetical protein
MADNIELSPGAGGAKMRAYKDSSGNAYAPAAIVYMTSTTDGAAVAQPVQVGHGLPVQQDGTWVVNPGDTPNTVPWLTTIQQGGNAAVVNGSGQLTVLAAIDGTVAVGSIASIVNPVTVQQSTASSLLCTANIAAGQTLATVTNVGSVTSVTNPVTVAQNTPGNLLATVSIASAQTLANVTTVGTITNPVTVAQATAANLKATVNIAAAQTLDTVTTVAAVTSITNPVTIVQATAANLNATVSIAANQTVANVTTVSTITNPVTVAQATASSLNCTAIIGAGTNLIGKAAVGQDTSAIYNGATALTPSYAVISASSSGDNQIVAAQVGKKIRVLQWSLTSNGTVSATWRSGTTPITGARPLIQYASCGGSFSPIGRFETAAGSALNLNLSGATAVGGEIAYVLI